MLYNFILMLSLRNKLANHKNIGVSLYFFCTIIIAISNVALVIYDKIGLSLTGVCSIGT